MNNAAAIILTPNDTASAAKKTSRLLEFFGVPSRRAGVEEFWPAARAAVSRLVIFCSPEIFRQLQLDRQTDSACEALWQEQVASAFVHGDGAAELAAALGQSEVVECRSEIFSVAEGPNDLCGVMAGVRCPVAAEHFSGVRAVKSASGAAIIANAEGAIFLQLEVSGVPVFFSTAPKLVNLDAPLPARVFDIRTHFLSAVPLVLFIKRAFAATCWQPPETTACLVIDDPRLTPRYGFLNFQRLLGLMEQKKFTTSIAFIPWNCNRSTRKTVRLFQENPERLSLSIHGCDHTAAEYGSRNHDRLAWKSRQAVQRMARHRDQTGLAHDPVMVFPQGVFSEAAMAALKHEEFIGVVNSEVISTDPQPRTITIGDYWNVAVMNYSDFPIFTRRYPSAGMENFAFDILLGKPCLIVVHHNDVHDDYRYLLAGIEGLNRLNVRLRWTNLAEVARRSFRQREADDGAAEVEMFGRELRLENPAGAKRTFRVHKRESAPETIAEIRSDDQPVPWRSAGNRIAFEVTLPPGAHQTLAVIYQSPGENKFPGESLPYQIKAMVRRYLCEFRDNFVMKKSFSQ